jgi:hypothetical protein
MTNEKMIEFLNEKNKNGWELCGIMTQRVFGDDCYNYIFKRKLKGLE